MAFWPFADGDEAPAPADEPTGGLAAEEVSVDMPEPDVSDPGPAAAPRGTLTTQVPGRGRTERECLN